MKKKQLHAIVKYFYPVAAGIETNMKETYKVFSDHDWEVNVHTTTDTLTESNMLAPEEKVQSLSVHRTPWKWYGFSPNIPWETADVVALHNFNVFPQMQILLTALFRKMMHKKVPVVVLTPHGGFTPDWTIFPWPVRIAKYLYHYSVGMVLINGAVDGVRAVSEWEKQEIIKFGVSKKKVVVISNGIEAEAYEADDKNVSENIKDMVYGFGEYIIQIGRIYPIKNYETTIRALVNIPEHIHYVIAGPVGSEAYFDGLKSLIKKLNLQTRVHFVGVIRGRDKYFLIRNAKLMVHMARWESFCNVVHEGMSQGLPCIVANNTALPLLIKDGVNGYCVKTHDIAGLTEKLLFIFNNYNNPQIQLMKERNTAFGRQFSWTDVGTAFEKYVGSFL